MTIVARTPARDAEPVVAVVLALVVTVVCTLPLWLTGALAVQIRSELQFGLIALGGAVAIFRSAGALAAAPLGALADRLGPMQALRLSAIIAAGSSLGVALHARTWSLLVLWLAVSGTANTLGHTSANLILARTVPLGRQGVAFGFKQAAVPIGSLIAGLTVPLVALTVGWRWGFVLSSALATVVAMAVPWRKEDRLERPETSTNRGDARGPLVVLSVGLFFGMCAASALTAFIVEGSTAAGIHVAAAGLLLTLGSAVSILVRIYAGIMADRRGRGHLREVALMQVLGMVGFLLMGFGASWSIVLGSVIAFAFGWGYNGLFWFAIVRLNQATPGRATGLVMPGGLLGGMVGPLGFGCIVEVFSYTAAWLAMAACTLCAAGTLMLGRSLLLADLRLRESAT